MSSIEQYEYILQSTFLQEVYIPNSFLIVLRIQNLIQQYGWKVTPSFEYGWSILTRRRIYCN
jgi:hypothetical protein